MEQGFYPVRIVKDDPLFEGVPDPFVVRQSHYCEVKTLPEAFELLASSEECRIQAMKHKTRLIYSTQFHPEGYVENYPDGRTILCNFFGMAGIR
jgi:GMP synthase (glutamine-hydrolysing)